MSQKDTNSSKLVWKEIWSILRWMIPSPLVSGIQFVPFFSKLLEQLSQYSKIPLPMLRWSLVLVSFVILSLVYTSIYLYRTRELKLPNKKQTGLLLFTLLINKFPYFIEDSYAKSVGYKESTIRVYIKTLIVFRYLVKNDDTSIVSGKKRKSYSVTDDGIKYLVRHKFIR
jgi:hypothetical protein